MELFVKVVTLGEKGNYSQFQEDKSPTRMQSVSGAGDALFAGFICGLKNHFDSKAAIKFGLRASQKSLTATCAVNPDIASIKKDWLRGKPHYKLP